VSTPVFLAVDAATADLTGDDRVLAEAIVAAGSEALPVVWGERLPPASMLVIRSTWDYVEDPNRFVGWLSELDAGGVVVHNPTSLLRWNLHKRYLVDLIGRGVPTVPTVVLSQGDHVELGALLRGRSWNDAVIKPAIGGTARLAVHVEAVGIAVAQGHLDELLAAEDAIVQQFVPSVPLVGETSVIAIGGVVTHAVRKRVTAGEWRVHAEFGGRSEAILVDDRLASAAHTAIAAVQPIPTYARVDLVENPTGELQLIELELVEPELFFRLAAHAATRLAHDVLTHGGGN
jgi:glutathione synthase/RimK-type ligase-like ATP-grasp enzyme